MKPAPFKDIRVEDVHGIFKMQSSQKGILFPESTRVTDARGKTVWKMREFLGRWQWRLSPDGQVLLLFGDYHFGSAVALKPDAIIVKVYEMGAHLRSAALADALGGDPKAWVSKRKIEPMSNQWVAWSDLFGSIDPDWKRRIVTLPVHGSEALVVRY
jgi:hypothetical protein